MTFEEEIRQSGRYIRCQFDDCSKALTFGPLVTDGCETGALRPLLVAARQDEALREPQDPWEERAYDAHVCDDHRIGPGQPGDVLVSIAERYHECFSVNPKAVTAEGHRLAFMVRLDNPSICAAPIRKQDGRWVDDQGRPPRLLCWPGAVAEQMSGPGKPRPCTRAELLRLDIPPEVIDRIDR